MAEETKKIEEGTQPAPNAEYIKIIEQLKANTVSKEEYEAVKADNAALLESLYTGTTPEGEEETQPVDIKELRDSLFKKENNNLDYVTKAMELRKALIDSGEKDPFLPDGHNISPSDEDRAAAERVAEAFEHCIDYAEGDSALFTAELQRITTEAMPAAWLKNHIKQN